MADYPRNRAENDGLDESLNDNQVECLNEHREGKDTGRARQERLGFVAIDAKVFQHLLLRLGRHAGKRGRSVISGNLFDPFPVRSERRCVDLQRGRRIPDDFVERNATVATRQAPERIHQVRTAQIAEFFFEMSFEGRSVFGRICGLECAHKLLKSRIIRQIERALQDPGHESVIGRVKNGKKFAHVERYASVREIVTTYLEQAIENVKQDVRTPSQRALAARHVFAGTVWNR